MSEIRLQLLGVPETEQAGKLLQRVGKYGDTGSKDVRLSL